LQELPRFVLIRPIRRTIAWAMSIRAGNKYFSIIVPFLFPPSKFYDLLFELVYPLNKSRIDDKVSVGGHGERVKPNFRIWIENVIARV
jgi:hypothetical protein